MQGDSFKIGLVQYGCVEDRSANMSWAVAGVREAAGRGAQVICLPELFNGPYFCKVEAEERFELAEPIPGPSTEAFQPIARELEVVIIVPLFERRGPGVYHNSAAVIDADGTLLGVYRKMHIPDDPMYYEKFYFSPGDAYGQGAGFRVFQTRYAKVGVLICWDQWYPEAARIAALQGAEVLFYPTAIGWHPEEKEQFGEAQVDAWQTVQRGHAIANGIYVGATNRVGHEPEEGTAGIEFFGRSFICDPFGRNLAEAGTGEAEVLVAQCSRRYMEQVRRNWPFFRDRRIDAYQPITQRFIQSDDS